MSTHRPILTQGEIDEIVMGLFLRLEQLIDDRQDRESTEAVYNLIQKLTRKKRGRPKYLRLKFGDDRFWDFMRSRVKVFHDNLARRR